MIRAAPPAPASDSSLQHIHTTYDCRYDDRKHTTSATHQVNDGAARRDLCTLARARQMQHPPQSIDQSITTHSHHCQKRTMVMRHAPLLLLYVWSSSASRPKWAPEHLTLAGGTPLGQLQGPRATSHRWQTNQSRTNQTNRVSGNCRTASPETPLPPACLLPAQRPQAPNKHSQAAATCDGRLQQHSKARSPVFVDTVCC